LEELLPTVAGAAALAREKILPELLFESLLLLFREFGRILISRILFLGTRLVGRRLRTPTGAAAELAAVAGRRSVSGGHTTSGGERHE
jgi:hypothetical protein